MVPRSQVRSELADSPQSLRAPKHFDLINIIAAPASGSTTTLIGSGAAVSLGPVPCAWRGVVTRVFTYLEGATGPISGWRIPGAGVTMTWQLLVNAQPAYPYDNITTILSGFEPQHALLEIPQSGVLTAQVTNTDPNGLYLQIGIRVVGQFLPLDKDMREARR